MLKLYFSLAWPTDQNPGLSASDSNVHFRKDVLSFKFQGGMGCRTLDFFGNFALQSNSADIHQMLF